MSHRALTEKQEEWLITMNRKGYTVLALSKALGCSSSAAYRVFERKGIAIKYNPYPMVEPPVWKDI